MNDRVRLQVLENSTEHEWKDVGHKTGDQSVPISVTSLPLPSGAATAAKQDTQTTLLQGIAGFTVTGYDYIALTYVAAGNGVGEVETATFKTGGSGGTTIAILTLTYNVAGEISSVTKT